MRQSRDHHGKTERQPVETAAEKHLAGVQIRWVVLKILLENYPKAVDFDAVRDRVTIPKSIHHNVFGAAASALSIDHLITQVGVIRSLRPAAKSGKRNLWRLVNHKRAQAWVEAYANVLTLAPQFPLWEGGGE